MWKAADAIAKIKAGTKKDYIGRTTIGLSNGEPCDTTDRNFRTFDCKFYVVNNDGDILEGIRGEIRPYTYSCTWVATGGASCLINMNNVFISPEGAFTGTQRYIWAN